MDNILWIYIQRMDQFVIPHSAFASLRLPINGWLPLVDNPEMTIASRRRGWD